MILMRLVDLRLIESSSGFEIIGNLKNVKKILRFVLKFMSLISSEARWLFTSQIPRKMSHTKLYNEF